MIRVGTLPTEMVKPFIKGKRKPNEYMQFQGFNVKITSQRYVVFLKSLNCISCSLKGTFFAIERSIQPNAKEERYHFNLYGIDEHGDEVMLTKDHILPKSRGGKNHISNYQTMCKRCNERKGNKLKL